MNNAPELTLTTPPKYAGTYWVGGEAAGLALLVLKRPSWLHRVMMRVVFGWVWQDSKEEARK